MDQQSNNSNNSVSVLEHNRFEAVKYLSMLLAQEINSFEQGQTAPESKIENEKPICLLEEIQRFEINMIRCALIRSMGNQTKAAKLLGIKTNTLNMKIKRYKIDLTQFKNAKIPDDVL